jgi:serine phosphatase RsbU (regulator of sigma subunit)
MAEDERASGYRPPGRSDRDSFAGSLPLPATGPEVGQFVAQRAAACVGAEYSNLAVLNAAQDALRLFHGPFLTPDLVDRYTDVPLDAPYPIAVAARRGEVILLPDLDSYREQYPEILSDTVAAGVQATASLPLYRADGTVLGAIGFAWTEPIAFDRKLEAALRAVAHLCVETVERAERYDAEHELIIELQARLLGDLPALAGIETFARYLPANREPAVGGDWYEGLVLGPSSLAVVVGDVTGHGIAAAADMALIRGMISALLHSGLPASDVFREVSGLLSQRHALVLATAACAIVEIATETVTFATAGHPPPLIRYPDGQVRTLDTANCPMIGIHSTRCVEDTAPFPLGSQLVMFTDGLVERRDRPFDQGIAQMAAHLAALPERLDPRDLGDSLLKELIGEARAEDDIAILVVEHTA